MSHIHFPVKLEHAETRNVFFDDMNERSPPENYMPLYLEHTRTEKSLSQHKQSCHERNVTCSDETKRDIGRTDIPTQPERKAVENNSDDDYINDELVGAEEVIVPDVPIFPVEPRYPSTERKTPVRLLSHFSIGLKLNMVVHAVTL